MPEALDEELWEALPEKLASCQRKLGHVKAGQWFSLNEQGVLQMQECTASRMIRYLDSPETPDDVVQHRSDFKNLSGLKLAYMAHSWRTFENLTMLLNVQQPLFGTITATARQIPKWTGWHTLNPKP